MWNAVWMFEGAGYGRSRNVRTRGSEGDEDGEEWNENTLGNTLQCEHFTHGPL